MFPSLVLWYPNSGEGVRCINFQKSKGARAHIGEKGPLSPVNAALPMVYAKRDATNGVAAALISAKFF